ncbi:putative endogenous retrovirus group K member [Dirofilaria immitis]
MKVYHISKEQLPQMNSNVACGKINKWQHKTDGVFRSFANEFGQGSVVLSEADRNAHHLICDNEQTWDWSKEQIKKRLIFILPRNELKWQQCNDDLCNMLLDASKMLLKNILEEALKMKRSHLTNSTGICHMFGARKRRAERDRFTDPYVLQSMKTPLCATDITDALRADCRFISNTWIQQLLLKSLERIRKLC